eukprot:5934805-Pleurochrysis_carterae.AAC.6
MHRAVQGTGACGRERRELRKSARERPAVVGRSSPRTDFRRAKPTARAMANATTQAQPIRTVTAQIAKAVRKWSASRASGLRNACCTPMTRAAVTNATLTISDAMAQSAAGRSWGSAVRST